MTKPNTPPNSQPRPSNEDFKNRVGNNSGDGGKSRDTFSDNTVSNTTAVPKRPGTSGDTNGNGGKR